MDLKFFEKLKSYPYSELKSDTLAKVKSKIDNCTLPGGFNYESFKKKSKPSGSLCNWVVNWYKAASAVCGVSTIKDEMDHLDQVIAFKYSQIEKKEQDKLMNYIPPDTMIPPDIDYNYIPPEFLKF